MEFHKKLLIKPKSNKSKSQDASSPPWREGSHITKQDIGDVKFHLSNGLDGKYIAGIKLIELRSKVKWGEWPSVVGELGIDRNSGYKYMKIAREISFGKLKQLGSTGKAVDWIAAFYGENAVN